MSASELAARIRAKFPSDYDDVPDDELTARIVSKYNDYRSDLKEFSVQGAEKLNGLQTPFLRHYLNLYDQLERAGVTPIIKSGVRTAEQQNYLHRTGHPTHGNDGYNQISPHQEGRAIDFGFSPEQKSRGQQILAQYARANGLHIPSDEPWHVAILKDQAEAALGAGEPNPYQTPDWAFDPAPTTIRSDYTAQAQQARTGRLSTVPREPQIAPQAAVAAPQVAVPHLSVNDAAWHLGMTPREAQRLSRNPKAVQVLTTAVAEDERKKAAGETIAPPSLKYQNEMRIKAGLKPLAFNVKVGPVSPYYQPDSGGELPILTKSGKPLEKRGGGIYAESQTLGGQIRPIDPAKVKQSLADAAFRGLKAHQNAIEQAYQGPERANVAHLIKTDAELKAQAGQMADEQIALEARRPEIDRIKARIVDFAGNATEQGRLTQSVWNALAGSGVQLGNLINVATRGHRGSGLVDTMRLAQHALAELDHEDPDKGWLAAAERTLPGAGFEASKMMLLSGIPLAGRLTLPGLGAFSEADKGLAAAARGAIEGELFHRGFGLTAAMNPVGKFLTWTSIPAAIAIAQGVDPKTAILSNTAFGAMALVHPAKVRVSERGRLRDATIEDIPAIESGKLKVATPGATSGVPTEADVQLQQQFKQAQEAFRAQTEKGQSNAIKTGQIAENDLSQRVGTPQGEDLRPYSGEVRSQEGTSAVSRDRAGESGQVEQEGRVAAFILPNAPAGYERDTRSRLAELKQSGMSHDEAVAEVARQNRALDAEVKAALQPGIYRTKSGAIFRVERDVDGNLTEYGIDPETGRENNGVVARWGELAGAERISNDPNEAYKPDAKAPQVGEPLSHRNPVIAGKPIVATTETGKAIVANPENKGGISVVTHQPEVPAMESRTAEVTPPRSPATASTEQPPLAEVVSKGAASTSTERIAYLEQKLSGMGADGATLENTPPERLAAINDVRADLEKLRAESPSVREGEKIYLRTIVKSSPMDALEERPTELTTVGNSQGAFVGQVGADGKLRVVPNSELSFRPDAIKRLFPTITESQFKAGNVNPVVLEKTAEGSWRVQPKPSPREVIETAGLKYKGEQQRPKGKSPLQLFDTPDGSTLAIEGEVTPQTVAAKVKAYYEKKAGLPVVPEQPSETEVPENVQQSTAIDTGRVAAPTVPREPDTPARDAVQEVLSNLDRVKGEQLIKLAKTVGLPEAAVRDALDAGPNNEPGIRGAIRDRLNRLQGVSTPSETVIIPDHPDPVVDAQSKEIISHIEGADLGALSAAIKDAPPEVRARIQGLTAEITKEKVSGQETTPIERSVEPGSEAGAKVPEANQGAPRVPELAGAARAEDVALQEQLRQAQAEFRASRVPQEPTENLGPGAASVKEKFPEVKERQFGVKLMADEQIARDIKDSLGTSRYYEPIGNDVTAKDAQRLVDERGIPQSMHAIMDENNNIPFHVRSAMGQIVIKRLNKVYRGLKASEPSDAEIVLDQATNMAEWQMDYGTRLGQGVQSFAMWARLSPEGKLLTFKRAVNKARQRHLALKGGEVQQILKGMEDGRVVDVKPEDVVPVVPAIRKALAKRAVKARKAAESGQEDVSIWQEYKDSIAKQLFNIASPGKTKPSPPLQEFSERLLANVEPLIRKPETQRTKPDLYGDLREVVENFDKYRDAWNEAVSYIRGKYDQKSVAELSEIERRITDLHSAFQTKAFDRVFADAVKQAEINFQDVAKAHYLDRQGTRDSLTRDIFTGLGIKLSPEDAVDLADRIEQRMEAKIIIARQRILKGMENSNSVAKKVSSLTDKILEAARVGVLNEQKFYDIASEKLGLPKYDPQVAAKILDLAGHVEDAPEGLPQDRAILDLHRYMAEQTGYGPFDLPTGIYYGNILSGYNTHIVNAVDTALNVASEVNGLAMMNPRAAAKIYGGMLRGFTEGRFDALMALTEGRMKTDNKWMEVPRLMEAARFGEKGGVPLQTSSRAGRAMKAVAESKIAYPLNAYKYVTRMLAASDTVFAQAAKEARASLLAHRMAQADGLSGDALHARVREILGLDRDADFTAQAVREGFKGSEIKVRANELRDMFRDATLESDAADFAGEATYNHDPHGLLGIIAQHTAKLSQTIPPLKLFVPFTRIVANVTNRGLNYTPYGYKRAYGYGKVVDGRYQFFGEPLTPEAHRLMLTRATLGTAGLVLLGSLQAAGVLTIHGAGPSDRERRRQLQTAGWRPYSIQLGNHFVSYLPTPLGLGLSMVGNMSDAERYHELDQKDVLTKVAYSVARLGSTVFSQSFLSGLSRLFNALSENPNESISAVKQTLSGTASSMLVPNLEKDIYKLWDNKAYQSNTLAEDLIRNIPFAASHYLKPQLNAFGEPVRVQRQRFLDVMTSDPEWRFVVEKGLRVLVPSRTSEIEETNSAGEKVKRRIEPDEYYELLQKTGPQVKLWIGTNRDRLAAMTEQDAQEELSKEAGQITAKEMKRLRRSVKVEQYEQRIAVPTVPAEPSPAP